MKMSAPNVVYTLFFIVNPHISRLSYRKTGGFVKNIPITKWLDRVWKVHIKKTAIRIWIPELSSGKPCNKIGFDKYLERIFRHKST